MVACCIVTAFSWALHEGFDDRHREARFGLDRGDVQLLGGAAWRWGGGLEAAEDAQRSRSSPCRRWLGPGEGRDPV